MTEETIAYCGLVCGSCPIHLATIEKDRVRQQALRESIVRMCYKKYGLELKPGDITDCDGCLSDSDRLFSGCLQCEIRKCARKKHISNCALCPDFPCALLREHFSHEPEAGSRLEVIRRSWNG